MKSKYVKLCDAVSIHTTKSYAFLRTKTHPYLQINRELKEVLIYLNNQKEGTTIENLFLNTMGNSMFQNNKLYLKNMIDYLVSVKVVEISDRNSGAGSFKERTGFANGYFPLHVSFELTYKCNFNCPYCYGIGKGTGKKELSIEEKLHLIDLLADYGLKSIELTGGEPLLLGQNFIKILKKCYDRLDKIGILSNGSLFTNNLIKHISEYRDKISGISISLDSMKEEIFNEMSGTTGNFNKVIQNIKNLKELGYVVRVALVYSSKNYEEIDIIARYFGDRGIIFSFSPIMDFGGGALLAIEETRLINPDKMMVIINKAKKYTGEMDDLLQKTSEKNISFFKNCGAGHKNFVIDPYGNVKPCLLSDEVFGNLLSDRVVSIFTSDKVIKWANFQQPTEKTCPDCPSIYYCKGCIVRAQRASKELSYCNYKVGL